MPPMIVVRSRHETYPGHDNILYLTYLCMHVKQRCGGTYVQERCPCPNFSAEYLCAFPRCTCVRRPSYVFLFPTVQDQDGCHGTAAGSKLENYERSRENRRRPRDNFSRRDLITAFGRLQHYSTVLYSARVGAARSPCKAMTRDPIRAEVMPRLQSCYVPRRGQLSIPLRLSL